MVYQQAAKELDKELRELNSKKDQAIRDQNFDEAGNCRDLEMEIRAQITAILNAQGGANKNYNPVVEEENIAEIVSAWTGIPVSKVSKSETEKLIKWKNFYTNV